MHTGNTDAPPLTSKFDLKAEEERVLVFLVPVAPGEYEIDRTGGHFVFTTYWTDEKFSLPFTVEEGKTTYVGEYTFRANLGGEFLGPFFSYSSNAERDYPLLAVKYPEFNAESAVKWQPEKSVLFHVIEEGAFKMLGEAAAQGD